MVAVLLASACLPRPGGQGVGSEQDGALCAGQLPVTHTWPHRTLAPTGESGIPLGPAPEDAPHCYLSACAGKKRRKEGKEQPQAGAARSCGLRVRAQWGCWASWGGKGARGGGGGVTHRAARLLILPFLAVQTADLSLGTRMRDSLKETPAEKQTDERTDRQTDGREKGRNKRGTKSP